VRTDTGRVLLELESHPAVVALVRSALSALAETLGLEAELLNDVKTAVSEACNNVVLHAYEDEQTGPLRVSIATATDGLDVRVQDRGGGIRRVAAAEDRMGVGLALISALASSAEFSSSPDGGTDVRMSFDHRAPGLRAPDGTPGTTAGLEGDLVVSLAPVSLLGAMLGRLSRAVAAGAHFSLDRFAELPRVTDAISAHVQQHAFGEEIEFAIEASPRRLELTVGPFPRGAGDPDGLAALVDELKIDKDADHELLHVVIVDRR
jgi:anti-sigma regulatory factor (Ser/Thr protein kinase)